MAAIAMIAGLHVSPALTADAQLIARSDGTFSTPHDVAFDHEGRLPVADSGNNQIAVYRIDGVKGTLFESWTGRLRNPEGVAVHGDTLWISDTYNHRILAFRLRW